jgi:iron complex outermembrane receptor protein
VALSDRIPLWIPGVPVTVVRAGNPALDPAIILSGEVGIIHSFGTNSRLEVNGFYNRTTDITGATGPNTPPTATPPTYPFIFLNMANVGTFEAFGLEASLTGRMGQHFHWDFNYTWTHAGQNIVGNDGGRFERPLALDAGTPEHKAKAQLSYEQGPWLASVAARYTSDIQQLVAPNPLTNRPLTLVPIDDSLAVDAKLAFKLSPALTFSVAGANLTNSGTAGLSPVPDERRLSAAVQVRF